MHRTYTMHRPYTHEESVCSEKEKIRNTQKGTTKKAPIFNKSSVSLVMAPILDQSPLYLIISSPNSTSIQVETKTKLNFHTLHRRTLIRVPQRQIGRGVDLQLSAMEI